MRRAASSEIFGKGKTVLRNQFDNGSLPEINQLDSPEQEPHSVALPDNINTSRIPLWECLNLAGLSASYCTHVGEFDLHNLNPDRSAIGLCQGSRTRPSHFNRVKPFN